MCSVGFADGGPGSRRGASRPTGLVRGCAVEYGRAFVPRPMGGLPAIGRLTRAGVIGPSARGGPGAWFYHAPGALPMYGTSPGESSQQPACFTSESIWLAGRLASSSVAARFGLVLCGFSLGLLDRWVNSARPGDPEVCLFPALGLGGDCFPLVGMPLLFSNKAAGGW